jgi:hypothetical protein
MRNIGHQLLLQSGDSTSRVLPIVRIDKGTYQIGFEREFSFSPDSLQAITLRNLAFAGLEPNHIVAVLDEKTLSMIYGYESKDGSPSIDPCRERIPPVGNYRVQIIFTDALRDGGDRNLVYGGAIALGVVAIGFLFWRKRSDVPNNVEAIEINKDLQPDAKLGFDEIDGSLKFNGEKIPLTNKESKLLRLLVAKVNQVVDRDELQTGVWKSEGVITGRSLDMFISRLRKKFGAESGVKIVNIHGKGYRLEMRD